MKIPKPIIYVFALVGFAYVAFGLYLSSGLANVCQVQNIAEAISPNTQRVARLEVKKCNDGRSPMVVLNISDQANPNQEQAAELGMATTTDFSLTWLSNLELRLMYPRTFKLSQSYSLVGGAVLSGIDIALIPKPDSSDSFQEGVKMITP
jgi:hypothetical protein